MKSRGECQGEDTLIVHATCHKDSLYYTLQERTVDGVDTASISVIRTRTYPLCFLMRVVSLLIHVIMEIG